MFAFKRTNRWLRTYYWNIMGMLLLWMSWWSPRTLYLSKFTAHVHVAKYQIPKSIYRGIKHFYQSQSSSYAFVRGGAPRLGMESRYSFAQDVSMLGQFGHHHRRWTQKVCWCFKGRWNLSKPGYIPDVTVPAFWRSCHEREWHFSSIYICIYV